VLYPPRNLRKLDIPHGARVQLHSLRDLYSEIKIESCRLVRHVPELAAILCIADACPQSGNMYVHEISKNIRN